MTSGTQFNTKVTLFTKVTTTNGYGERVDDSTADVIVGGRAVVNQTEATNVDGLLLDGQTIQLDLRETTRTRLIELGDRMSINNQGWVVASTDDGLFQNGILRFTVRRDV